MDYMRLILSGTSIPDRAVQLHCDLDMNAELCSRLRAFQPFAERSSHHRARLSLAAGQARA